MSLAKEKDTIFKGLDYYPFGMQKPGRSFASGEYKYGFNDMLKDDELKGEGNSYDFGARIYDPRLGKFLSVDPQWKNFAGWSPYAFAINNPIRFIDVNGEGPGDRIKAARSMVGKSYKQETGYLRTGTSTDALQNMDCSEFVCRVMAADKITPKIESMNSSAIKKFVDDKSKFIHSNTPQAGDIAVWEGHVGIVSSVDKDGKIKLVHARGAGKLSSENAYHILPSQYRSSTFYGYYRPKEERPDGENNNSESQNTTSKTVKVTEPEKVYKYGIPLTPYYEKKVDAYFKALQEDEQKQKNNNAENNSNNSSTESTTVTDDKDN